MANEIGLRLNNDKSKILTSINGTSPIQHIPDYLQTEIQQCIKEFTNNKETTTGIKILGFPVDNAEFIQNNLNNTHTNVIKTYNTLKRKLNDTQTITQLVITASYQNTTTQYVQTSYITTKKATTSMTTTLNT